MAQDPICGGWVEDGSLQSEFEGQIYYFCSEDCLHEFEDDPERFVGWGGSARSGSA